MSAIVDGRPNPLVTARDTVRIALRTSVGPAVLQGASSLELLDAPDIWNHPINGGSRAVEVPMPSEGDVLWRILDETRSAAEAEVHVLRKAPGNLGPFLTHPDWQGNAPSGSYRFSTKLLTVPGERIRLLVAVAGVLSVTVNGNEASPILAPGVADFRRETPAVAFDLTNVADGSEEVEVALEIASGPAWVAQAEGRYSKLIYEGSPLAFCAQIFLGEGAGVRTVTADTTWAAELGASRTTNWYGGEDFRVPNADPTAPVIVDLARQLWWPEHSGARVMETLPPTDIQDLPDGARVFDFGRNIAGRPCLQFPADSTGSLTVRPAELTSESGHVTQWSTGSPIFHTVHSAGGLRSWAPRFMYNGFRYLQIEAEGCEMPQPEAVRAQVIRVNNTEAGSFRSTNEFLSTLHGLVVRAVEGNMHSMFTDCPHREKLGWLEQMHLCFTALARNFDVEAHIRDALHHMRQAQLPSGAIPSTTPDVVDFSGIEFRGDSDAFRHDPNWGRAIVSTTWKHYITYGDRRVLADNIDAIDRYLAYLDSRSTDALLNFGLGDWIALEHSTSRTLVASHGYHAALRDGASVHRALGNTTRATALDSQADDVRAAVLARFSSSDDATQAELALLTDLAEADVSQDLFNALLRRIDSDGGRLTVGEIGLPALIKAFSRAGRDAHLLHILAQPEVPGYGYQVARGATSLTENWTVESGPEGEGSQNHFMLGMVEDWILEVVGGLRQHPHSVGWATACVRPLLADEVGHAAVTYSSVSGNWAVAWDVGAKLLDVSVPATAQAEISLPTGWTFADNGRAEHRQGPGHTRYELHRKQSF